MTLEFSPANIADVDPSLQTLRLAAEDAARRHDWQYLHTYTHELRSGDPQLWVDIWAPTCAIAARQLGAPEARAVLDEAIAGGYNQPEVHSPELQESFGADPDWADVLGRISGNVAPVPLSFLDWPTITPSAPLSLLRAPSESGLRDRLPPLSGSAWETALTLLTWTGSRWYHANAHMEVDDAAACLDRAAAGERFTCIEYALVLSQALNAVGIPSRRLSLRQSGYHAGMGRGHAVSEAWIDDLGRWVVLDGQNGFYWTAPDGTPLGTLELQAASTMPGVAYAPGAPPQPAEHLPLWFSYFDYIATTGVSWSSGAFVPVYQRIQVTATPLLLRDSHQAYPDLSQMAIGIELAGRECAIRLSTKHPYATGFLAGTVELPLDSPVWTLDTSPGEHTVELAVRTPFGAGRVHPFRYAVS